MSDYLPLLGAKKNIEKGNTNLLVFPIVILAIFLVALGKKN